MGGDPLLIEPIGDWAAVVAIVIGKVLIAFVLLLILTMLMIWFERKLVSSMHNRIGPSLAGPWGILQSLADGIKFFFKEDLIPDRAQRMVFILAPFLSVVPAFLMFLIVPLGGNFNGNHDGIITVFGHDTYLQVADPPIGILFLLAMSSIAVYGVMLAGWSSGSKYPLLGSVRASAQMVSYEAAMGLAVVAVVLKSGTLSTHGIAEFQSGAGFAGIVPNWNVILTGVVPFVIFVIAATAELNRPPFDLVEAEQELVGGFNTEYSSIRFALFFLAEFMNVITMSAIFVTLFLGGPSGPAFLGTSLGWLTGIIWFGLKTAVFLFMFVWIRASLPRLRYDQLMDLGWKVLIPLALGWLLLLGAIDIGRDASWNPVVVVVASVAILLAGYGLLRAAIAGGRARRLQEVEG
jgi:NADH-quinone oxidoreductase subunit H